MKEFCIVCTKKCIRKSLDSHTVRAFEEIFHTKIESVQNSLLLCPKCKQTLMRFHEFYVKTKTNYENLKYIGTIVIETKPELPTKIKCEATDDNYNDDNDQTEPLPEADVKIEQDFDNSAVSEDEPLANIKMIKNKPKTPRKRPKNRSVKKEPYTCDLCGKQTPRFIDLRTHIEKAHLRIRKFQCHLCGDKFLAKNNLNFHLTTHDDTRPRSECKICGVLVLDLKKHFRTSHNNSNPVVCNICGKTLMNEMKLRYHNYKRHPPEGKYRCKICDKDFCNALYLKEHTHQKHIGGFFLYSCEWCDFQTNYSKNMPTHQKLKHKEEFEARRRSRPPMLSRVHEMKASLALQQTPTSTN